MQEHKIAHVGDNSGVGKLLSFLPQFDGSYVQDTFSLQTDTEPYGITIYYEPVENVSDVNMNKTEEMITYAEYLFECVDNLGYVEFAYRTTSSGGEREQSEYTVLLNVERP